MSNSASTSSLSKDSGSNSLIGSQNNLPRDYSRLSLFSTMSGPSQDEHFRSEGHAEQSLSCMKNYLLAGKLCDVVLVAGIGGQRVEAHRLVLSAASEYFAAMFTGGLSNNEQTEIEIGEVRGEILKAIVDYCYTGAIEIREDNVETLLSTASLMLIHEVVEACARFLSHQLHPSNCLGIALFADIQSCASLYQLASEFTSRNFMKVIEHYEFLQLGVKDLASLLNNEDLFVDQEEDIFSALMKWYKHDPVNRKEHLGHLMSFVKLPLMSASFLTDHVEPVCADDPECQKLLMAAMKWHLLPERHSQMSSTRTRPRKATIGRLLVVGGMDRNKGSVSIETYDPRVRRWVVFDQSNGRRLQFGIALMGHKVIVVGGRDGLKTLSTMECLDLKSSSWIQQPPMNTHRHGLGVAVLGGTLYAVGGHDGWSYLNTVERWDPVTGKWKFVAPMQNQRCSAGVAVLNGYLYAVGGRDGASCLRSVEKYDPHADKWTSVAHMARRRGGVGVAVADGYLYAIGGQDAPANNPASSRFDCVERYDPSTDTWTYVSSISSRRDAVGACVFGDKIYAVGGYDGNHYLRTVEMYDPIANEWTPVEPLLHGRAGACVIVIDNTLINKLNLDTRIIQKRFNNLSAAVRAYWCSNRQFRDTGISVLEQN